MDLNARHGASLSTTVKEAFFATTTGHRRELDENLINVDQVVESNVMEVERSRRVKLL